jgi:hypothetical protein
MSSSRNSHPAKPSNNIGKYFTSFEGPSYVRWFIIPFAVLAVLGYLIGLPLVIKHAKAGGYLITNYDKKCESNGRLACAPTSTDRENDTAYNQCVQAYLEANCDSTQSRTGAWVPILLYVLLPLIIGSALAFSLYKLVIFVKNPKVAAGYFLARGVLHR